MTNWLARRSAGAYLGLQATPFVKATVPIASDPQEPDAHVVADHTRALFTTQPEDFVVKIRGSTPAKGGLKLRVTFERTVGSGGALVSYSEEELASYFAGTGVGAAMADNLYNSEWTTAGDNKYYANINVQGGNFPNGQNENGDPLYINWSTDYTRNADGSWTSTINSYSSDNPQKLTNGDAWVYNNDDRSYYMTFSNEVTYAGSLFASPNINYGAYHIDFTPRKTAASAHGLSDYIYAVGGDVPIVYPGTSGTLAIATFKGLSSWVPTDQTSDQKVRCRFIYDTPDSCEDCWYEGATVELKVRYKVSTMSRALTGTNFVGEIYEITLGSWSAHSEVTKTVTLPAKGTGYQLLGSDFNIPQEEGKVIAIDDIEVISVTPPAPPP